MFSVVSIGEVCEGVMGEGIDIITGEGTVVVSRRVELVMGEGVEGEETNNEH